MGVASEASHPGFVRANPPRVQAANLEASSFKRRSEPAPAAVPTNNSRDCSGLLEEGSKAVSGSDGSSRLVVYGSLHLGIDGKVRAASRTPT